MSLNGYLSRLVDDRLAAQYPTYDFDIYAGANWNPATPSFPRNPNCWAADFDFSFVSPLNSVAGAQGRQTGGSLITPRHLVAAVHNGIGLATFYFVDKDNVGQWY